MDKPRLGRISFVHSLPQYYPFEQGKVACPAQVISGLPGELNRLFASGGLEISPVSAFEYIRKVNSIKGVRHGPHTAAAAWRLVPQIGMASAGPAMSVVLVSDRPPEKLSGCRIAVPEYAATTPALLKLLLKHYWKVNAAVVVKGSAGDPARDIAVAVDAELLIGDDALRASAGAPQPARRHMTDLGEAWKNWTGKKMVYFVGVCQPAFREQFTAGILDALSDAMSWSRSHFDDIISVGAAQVGLPRATIKKYLGGLEFGLDDAALDGMDVFREWLERDGQLGAGEAAVPGFFDDDE